MAGEVRADDVPGFSLEAVAPPAITNEDRKRARDRRVVRTLHARGGFQPRLLWLLIGPGILAMLGENDAPSMLSYATTGAQFGVGFFLPFIVVTFLVAFIVQEQTVRLGAATHRGHAELIFERFGRFWGWFAMDDLMLGNFLTLVTEFIGIRAGLGFFGVPPAFAVLGGLALVVLAVSTARYWTWERLVLGLAIFNGLFIPVALLAHPQWPDIGRAFVTWGPLPGGLQNKTLLILVSNIGATVTPWMLFFQQSAVVDKGLTKTDVRQGRIDTALGACLAALFACAVVVAAAPLFTNGVDASSFQGAEFAQALEPFIGHVGATLFALGIFEAGLVAAITISTSSASAFGEVTGWARSLNRTVREGGPFYGVLLASAVLAAALVLIPGAPLLYIVLIVNVIAVLAMPPALLFLYLLVNDQEIMGSLRNTRGLNIVAGAAVVILTGAGLLFGVSVLFPQLFGG